MHPRKDLSADRRASEHSRLFAAEFAFHSTCSLAFAKTRPSHVIRRITTLLHGHNPPAPRRHVPHQNLLMSRSGSHKHLAMHPFIHQWVSVATTLEPEVKDMKPRLCALLPLMKRRLPGIASLVVAAGHGASAARPVDGFLCGDHAVNRPPSGTTVGPGPAGPLPVSPHDAQQVVLCAAGESTSAPRPRSSPTREPPCASMRCVECRHDAATQPCVRCTVCGGFVQVRCAFPHASHCRPLLDVCATLSEAREPSPRPMSSRYGRARPWRLRGGRVRDSWVEYRSHDLSRAAAMMVRKRGRRTCGRCGDTASAAVRGLGAPCGPSTCAGRHAQEGNFRGRTEANSEAERRRWPEWPRCWSPGRHRSYHHGGAHRGRWTRPSVVSGRNSGQAEVAASSVTAGASARALYPAAHGLDVAVAGS